MSESLTPEDVNRRFVEEHLRHRWTDFIEGGETEPHTEAILREVARQRVTLQRQGRNVLFFRDGVCLGGMMSATTSLNSNISQVIASSKKLTKSVLEEASIPAPMARQYSETQWEAAASFFQNRPEGTRSVVKPSDGRQGQGITTGVRMLADLEAAWRRAMDASRAKQLLIEEEVPGVDVRVFVVQGRAVAAATRIPPFIVGDGVSDVAELIEHLQNARKSHVYMKSRELKVDVDYLGRNGVDETSVLAAGEVCFLNGTANLSRGGVAVDLTDVIPHGTLQIAERAATAVPGLEVAGVDLLMPDAASAEGAVVLEINSSPNLLVHDAPAFGSPREVARTVAHAMVGGPLRSHRTSALTQLRRRAVNRLRKLR